MLRAAVQGRVRRVLIVDDNLALAENIAEILEIDGCSTRVAASAEEAFPTVLEAEPDVLVIDYRLPGINGAEFVKTLRETRAHVYTIVISAHTDEGTIKEASDAGAAFMAKPLDLRLLSRWVRDGSA